MLRLLEAGYRYRLANVYPVTSWIELDLNAGEHRDLGDIVVVERDTSIKATFGARPGTYPEDGESVYFQLTFVDGTVLKIAAHTPSEYARYHVSSDGERDVELARGREREVALVREVTVLVEGYEPAGPFKINVKRGEYFTLPRIIL